MNARKRLLNRRRSETIAVEMAGHRFLATVGFYPDGEVGEIFLNAARGSSGIDAFAADAAILASLALQHGASLDELRHALKHDSSGRAASPIGAALDQVAVLS